jgi:hypothetical protein
MQPTSRIRIIVVWALRFVHWDPELMACYLLEAQPCTLRCIMIGRNVQFVFDGSDVVIWRSASSMGGEAKTVYNVNFRNELFASSYSITQNRA